MAQHACLLAVGLVLFGVLSVLSAVCLIACDMLDWFLFRFGRYCLLVSVGTVCARGFFLGCLRTVMGTVRRCTPRHWFVNVQTHLKAGVCTPALARPSFGLKRTHRIVPCRARANNCCNVARCHQTGSHARLPSTGKNRCMQSTPFARACTNAQVQSEPKHPCPLPPCATARLSPRSPRNSPLTT